MALYGCGRPAYWVLNMPTGRVNNLNRDPWQGEWSNSSWWEERCLSEFKQPYRSCVKGTGPESKTH